MYGFDSLHCIHPTVIKSCSFYPFRWYRAFVCRAFKVTFAGIVIYLVLGHSNNENMIGCPWSSTLFLRRKYMQDDGVY